MDCIVSTNMRKHRRLLNVRLNPIHMLMTGTLAEGDFTPPGGEGSIKSRRRDGTRAVAKGSTQGSVAIDEPCFVAKNTVTAVLAKLTSTATFIINFFDA